MIKDFLNILLLLGAVQGIITSVLLFAFKPIRYTNTILGWLTLIIALSCLNIYILETGIILNSFWSVLGGIIPLIVLMPLGPLSYFYVKSMLKPEFRLSKKNRRHFYSIIIDLLPYLVTLLLYIASFFSLKSNLQLEKFVDSYFIYSDIPRWISLVIYLRLTYKIIKNNINTKNQQTTIKWVKRFTIGMTIFAIIWLLHLVPYVIPSLSDKLLAFFGWYPIYLPLVILIYWVGINGLIISLKAHRTVPKKIDNTDIKHVTIALEKAMKEDKLYLNPSLKLNDVIEHTKFPQKKVSAVLNQHMQKTFNEFINWYRIEDFKSRLLEDNSKNLTITGIAFECGFNSQATFQRTFKKLTKMSPKEFKQKYSKTE